MPPSDSGSGLARLFSGDELPLHAVLCTVLLTVVAALVGRFSPQSRKTLRFPFLLLVAFTLIAAFAHFAAALAVPTLEAPARSIAVFVEQLFFVAVLGSTIFFVLLPRLGARIPDIARDLIVGAAYALVFMGLLRRFGVEIWSLFATSAVATIVVGVSLQPTLANIFGGLALQIDGSIREGDWVRLPDKTEGKVREVRWRHTTIETRNWDTIIVPNSVLLQQNILVLGRRQGEPLQHRMWVHFHVSCDESPERVVALVEEALRATPIAGVAPSPPPNCILYSLSDDARPGALHYAVRYHLTDLAADDPTSSLVMARVHAALRRADIALALPHGELTVQDPARAREARMQSEIEARAEHLRGVSLFSSLTQEELLDVARKLRFAPFCKGEIITRQGAEAHWLYILTKGSTEARVSAEGQPDRIVGQAQAPTIIGEFGMLTGSPRRATVVATAPCECYRLDKQGLQGILEARPEIAAEMAEVVASRQAAFDELVARGVGGPVQAPRDVPGVLGMVVRFFGLGDDNPMSKRRG